LPQVASMRDEASKACREAPSRVHVAPINDDRMSHTDDVRRRRSIIGIVRAKHTGAILAMLGATTSEKVSELLSYYFRAGHHAMPVTRGA